MMRFTQSLSLLTLALLSSVGYAQSPYYYRNQGLTLGGLAGAVTGGVLGHQNGRTATGAVIGGAVGALAGAAIGDSVDNDVAHRQAAAYQQQVVATQVAHAVTQEDVIAMTQRQVSDNVIITQIKARGLLARPSSNDLITLSQAGVSESVIRAMQTAPLATAAATPVPVRVRPGVIVEEPYYYVAPPPPPPVIYRYGPPAYYWHPHGPPHYAPGVHWGITIGH